MNTYKVVYTTSNFVQKSTVRADWFEKYLNTETYFYVVNKDTKALVPETVAYFPSVTSIVKQPDTDKQEE